MIICPFIIGFSTNKLIIHSQLFDHFIVTYVKKGLLLVFSNTFRVDNLHIFKKLLHGKVHDVIFKLSEDN